MPLSEARKRANKTYDAEHMTNITIRVKKELDAEFRAAVAENGDKVNSVLRQAMLDYIAASKK